jgi:hypothetical protein
MFGKPKKNRRRAKQSAASRPPEDENQDEDRVKLPPLLGLRPGLYLAALYGALILCILFFIFLYPGLSKPGGLGVFSSEPSGAAVRIDGITRGATPCEIFIPRGRHTIEMVLPGFTPFVQEAEVGGRIFGSALFPSRTHIRGTLRTPDPLKTLAAAAAEYARWSLAMEPIETWQAPQRLSEGVYRTAPALGAEDREAAGHILETALSFTVTRAAARDLLRAKFLLDNGGLSPSPLTLLDSLREGASLLEKSPGAAPWLKGFLPEEKIALLSASAWYEGQGEGEYPPRRFEAPAYAPGPAALSVGGLRFIPAGGVFIAAEEVSRDSWEAFTGENPQWRAENRADLTARGLVQEEYLRDPEFEAYPDPAAPGISWYAAAAYCAWLNEKLPPNMREAGWTLRLPTEDEWEYAARFFENSSSGDGPVNFLGGLWEWCANPFAPLDFFPRDGLDRIDSGGDFLLERSVRGGSWVNTPGSIDPGTRGSLPPNTSSPFVGFRPFILPES